jgi:fatty-acyl-CoA synthase
MNQSESEGLALVQGPPLNEEPSNQALTLPSYLREVTGRFATHEALAFREGGHEIRWTYAELWERALEVARSLLALGVAKDTRVGVLMTNRPEWLSAAFGASIAGCTVIPLSTFSTAAELDYLLATSAVSILLAERQVLSKDFAAMLEELDPALAQGPGARSLRYPHLRHVVMVGELPPTSGLEAWAEFLARSADVPAALAEATAAEVGPTDRGAVLFSSGSTAQPKGVINSHRGMCIHLWRWPRLYLLDGPVRAWSPNGLFWSGNFAMTLGLAFSTGGTLVLQRTFDPEEAIRLMVRERINLPYAWPHQWKQLESSPGWMEADLSHMRYVDPILAHHPSIRDRGWHDPMHCYGSTETFTISAGMANDHPLADTGNGLALAGMTVKVVDPMSGATLRRGELGEIAVKGATLMLGYLGVPPEDTFDAEGFYRTGDGGWIDGEDRLHFEGRLTTIIKTGGANVSPVEVQATLESMDGVAVVAVVGVPDPDLGEMVVACIVPAAQADLTEDAVRAYAKERLASYKVPRKVLFLKAEELQMTGSAKVKPNELKALAARKLAEVSSSPKS